MTTPKYWWLDVPEAEDQTGAPQPEKKGPRYWWLDVPEAGDQSAAKAEAPREKPGMATSFGRAAAQGLTLGLADESYGLTRGIASMLRGNGFQRGYDEGVEEYRARDRDAKDANPITSVVGEVAGMLPGGVAAGATRLGARALGLTGPNLASRSIASAGSGGAIGAVQGFNNGEGDIEERGKNAVPGFVSGLAIGGVSPTIGLGVGKAVDAGMRTFRGAGSVPQGLTGAATDMLAEDFARAGGTGAIRQRMNELGPDALLLDASPSLQGRAQGLAIEPDTREAIVRPLQNRNAATNRRLAADLDETIGPAPTPSRIEAELEAGRGLHAEGYGPVMARARATNLEGLAEHLETQAINLRGPEQAAVRRVRQMLDIPGSPGQLDPNPRALHSIRETIDGLMETEQNSKVLRQLTIARRRVDEALAEAAPGIKSVDAPIHELHRQSEGLVRGGRVLDNGRTAVRPSELADELHNGVLPQGRMVGPSGEAFRMRQGLRAEIDREVGNKANDLVALRNVIKGDGDWNRDKLALVFGQREADRVIASVDREAAFRDAFNKIVENSQSAQRLAGRDSVKVGGKSDGAANLADAGTAVATAAGGGTGLAISIGGRVLRLTGAEAKRMAELARNRSLTEALTTPQGLRLEDIIRGVDQRMGVQQSAAAAGEQAQSLTQILLQMQGNQGSRLLPEGMRPSR